MTRTIQDAALRRLRLISAANGWKICASRRAIGWNPSPVIVSASIPSGSTSSGGQITDPRLARYWGLTAGYWLRLQTDHDLMERRRELGESLNSIRPRAA
ncbi:MAG: helix-turn-helix transcriptional regulator [Caulobacteraceae bacterium]